MTQAQGSDFAKFGELSEAELEAVEQALASIPDDLLSTGDRPAIESRIRRRLQESGVLGTEDTGGPLGVAEIPPVAFVGRAVGCLATHSSTLRAISHVKRSAAVAEAIAQTLGSCVRGGTEAVAADLLTYRKQVARALTAIELPALGDALLAD